ncbi:rCG52753 [Rattus norvegicus]|uniref:RCG52753 n=1 Tax=Rattus norvegicus TaxID=10116 RepID=A6IQW4_RAT|nr:rCG52753 [Rattus norvegicus]
MGASCHACIRGTSVHAEVQKLQIEAPHIIVRRCLIYLTGDTVPQIHQDFVLDEADEILSHGFKDQI